MTTRRTRARIAAVLSILLATGTAPRVALAADAYTNGPIRMVVPFPPGRGFDAVARPVTALIKQDLQRWKDVIAAANIPRE